MQTRPEEGAAGDIELQFLKVIHARLVIEILGPEVVGMRTGRTDIRTGIRTGISPKRSKCPSGYACPRCCCNFRQR